MTVNLDYKRQLESRVNDLESFLDLLQAYRANSRDWMGLGKEDRRIAEGMRKNLLLAQAKVRPLIGDVRYVQMGFKNSGWDGLGEPGYGHRGTQLTSLSLLLDATTSALGTAQAEFEAAKRARPTAIELTSLAYWASRVVHRARRVLPEQLSWSSLTTISIGVKGSIFLLAAVGGIITAIVVVVDRFG